MAPCSYSPVRKASDFDKCFIEVADPRLHQYRSLSRQFDRTVISSSMRLDVTRVCLQRANGWMKTSVFGCNDDGVMLLVSAQFIQDVHNGLSVLLLKYMHLILHSRRCGIPLVLLASVL